MCVLTVSNGLESEGRQWMCCLRRLSPYILSSFESVGLWVTHKPRSVGLGDEPDTPRVAFTDCACGTLDSVGGDDGEGPGHAKTVFQDRCSDGQRDDRDVSGRLCGHLARRDSAEESLSPRRTLLVGHSSCAVESEPLLGDFGGDRSRGATQHRSLCKAAWADASLLAAPPLVRALPPRTVPSDAVRPLALWIMLHKFRKPSGLAYLTSWPPLSQLS